MYSRSYPARAAADTGASVLGAITRQRPNLAVARGSAVAARMMDARYVASCVRTKVSGETLVGEASGGNANGFNELDTLACRSWRVLRAHHYSCSADHASCREKQLLEYISAHSGGQFHRPLGIRVYPVAGA